MSYAQLIKKIAPNHNARHVEAWLRAENPTLDALSPEAFESEVIIAVAAVECANAVVTESLALSFGIPK